MIWTMDTPRWLFPGRAIGTLSPGSEASVIGVAIDPREDWSAITEVDLAVKQGTVLEMPASPEKDRAQSP